MKHSALTLHLDLERTQFSVAPLPSGVTVEEWESSDLEKNSLQVPVSMGSAGTINSIVGAEWSAWVALLGTEVLHHSFVNYRETGPLLFRVWTHADHRGQGFFLRIIERMGTDLQARGYRSLRTSVAADNETSLRAHQKAGFEVAPEPSRFRRALKGLGDRVKRTLTDNH